MSAESPSRPVGVTLRLFREKWGWSQSATARRLRELSAYVTGREATVSADTVSRWERGVSLPRRSSQILLCQLFGAAPEDLGFSVAPPPVPPLPHSRATLAQLLGWWLDTIADRRMWLGPVLPYRFWPGIHPLEEDPLEYAVASIAWHRKLAETSTRESYGRALTQLHTLARLVREAGSPPKPLAHAVASTAQLITQLAFDQRELTVASWYSALAVVAAQEAGDAALEAYAFISSAHAYLEVGNAPHVLLAMLPQGLPPGVEAMPAALRAYISSVEAELRARVRDSVGAGRCLEAATAAMSLADREEPPAWLSFGHVEFAARYGRCLLVCGRAEEAQHWLEKALDGLDVVSRTRRRAAILMDLAAAHLGQGHSVDGCKYARQSLQFAAQADSDHVMERFNELYSLLFHLITEPEAKELLEDSIRIRSDYHKTRSHPRFRNYPVAPAQWD